MRELLSSRHLVAGGVALLGAVHLATANLNFGVVGNFGFSESKALETSAQLAVAAVEHKLSFLVSPGSNFQGGVKSETDCTWFEYYEKVFSDDLGRLKMPFFTVLGSEDWAGDVTAQIRRSDVDYETETREGTKTETKTEKKTEKTSEEHAEVSAKVSTEGSVSTVTVPAHVAKFTFPNWWYHYVRHFSVTSSLSFMGAAQREASVGFFFLDTFIISRSFPFKSLTEKCREDLKAFLSLGKKIFDYIVVVGDRALHSVRGSVDYLLRSYLDPLFEEAQVDLYIHGHNHYMESTMIGHTLHVGCGTFASGASVGLQSGGIVKSGIFDFFSGERGFCTVELGGAELKVRFHSGIDGSITHHVTSERKVRPLRDRLSPFSVFGKLPAVKYIPLPGQFVQASDSVDFVRVVGTLGLMIAGAMVILGLATFVSRMMGR